MQAFRRTVIATFLLSFTLAVSALPAPRDPDGSQPPLSRKVQKTQEPNEPWFATIITILDWLSIPPG